MQTMLSIDRVSKWFGAGSSLLGRFLASLGRKRSPKGEISGAGSAKNDPVRVVDRVSFEVGKGEIFGVLGQNGSGKSTLIRMISTLLLPDEGTITLAGRDVTLSPMETRRIIDRVSVEASFFKSLTPRENLVYAARVHGIRPSVALSRVTEILGAMSFDMAKMDAPMENLSRGMQQKVAIARSLMTKPDMLLLDEPTTGLDPKSRKEVQAFVLDYRRETGTTILLTSHDMAESEALCDRISILDRGRLTACGTLGELLEANPRCSNLEEVFIELTGRSPNEEGGET